MATTESKIPPTPEALADAAKLEVLDLDGKKVRFGTLFEERKAVFVFIRHFFCGSCHQYVTTLSSISQDALTQAGTEVIVIGCGEWEPIRNVLETTTFHGPIYADPSRKLYRALGMTTESLAPAPPGTERKSYLRLSKVANALKSIWSGPLQHPTLIGKQGNISQLGGEFIFGPGNQCTFSYRMQHTEDHTEVADLMQAAGVVYP